MSDQQSAKSTDSSLLLVVYRRYCSEVRQALVREVPQPCNGAPSSREERDSLTAPPQERAGDWSPPPEEKAAALLRSLEARLATTTTTEDGSKVMEELFGLLETRPPANDLVALIKDEIAYLERHHCLPPHMDDDSGCPISGKSSKIGIRDSDRSLRSESPVYAAYVENCNQLPPRMDDSGCCDSTEGVDVIVKDCSHGLLLRNPFPAESSTQPSQDATLLAIDCYGNYLRKLYEMGYEERCCSTPKRPSFEVSHGINLVCVNTVVQTEGQVKTHEPSCLAPSYGPVTELVDLAQREADGSIPQCVLVQGEPGSGKTMLCWELCHRWAKQKLLQHFSLVVLLLLRDLELRDFASLADLFPCRDKELQENVAAEMSKSLGRGLLLLLDGLDELCADVKNSFMFGELITGKLLPDATVLVTSRPCALQDLLQSHTDLCAMQHVEVVGFTADNVAEYVSKASAGDETGTGFHEYLDLHPHIRSSMATPLICALVVEMYMSLGSVQSPPRTTTQLYITLVKTLLQHHMQAKRVQLRLSDRINSFFGEQEIFTGLPTYIYRQLRCISKLAYQSLQDEQQLVFVDLPADFDTLGLLQRAPCLHDSGEGRGVRYNYLHLSIQEFLAAYYIYLHGHSSQQKCIDAVLRKENDFASVSSESGNWVVCKASSKAVCKFVAGLSGLRHKSWRSLDAGLFCSGGLTLASILFEAQNQVLSETVIGRAVQSVTSQHCAATPHGMNAVGYCISCTNTQWELEMLDVCGDHIQCLQKGVTSWGPACGKIANCKLHFTDSASKGLRHFLSLPRNVLCELTTLDLSKSPLVREDIETLVRHLSSSLAEKHDNALLVSLRELRLAGSGLDCECTELLSQALSTNNSLTSLYLDHNRKIMDQGGCSLARSLKINTTLTCLDIYATSVGINSVQCFNESLKHNTTLQSLYLPYLSKLIFAKLGISTDKSHLRKRLRFTSSKPKVPHKESTIVENYDEDFDMIVCEVSQS